MRKILLVSSLFTMMLILHSFIVFGQQTDTKKPKTFIKHLKEIHAAIEFYALMGATEGMGKTESVPSEYIMKKLEGIYNKTDKCDKDIYVKTHDYKHNLKLLSKV